MKVVYLMRDPVARLVSATAMAQRSAHDIGEGIAADVPLEQAVADYYTSAPARVRSDYAASLACLTEAFEPSERFICLFETLFTPEGHEDLSRFLDLPPAIERITRIRHAARARRR